MRKIIIFTATLVLTCTLLFNEGFSSGEFVKSLKESASKYSTSLKNSLYEKDIFVSGNKRLNSNEIVKSLPREKSIAWWLFNEDALERELLDMPLIEKAEVRPCSFTKWGCFNIRINERKPEYIAIIGDKPWLIGTDGGFIAPLDSMLGNKKNGMQISSVELKDAVLIKGLLESDYSPDVLQVKINFLSQAISIIEKKIKWKVKEAVVNSDSEIAVKFAGHDFAARFTFDDASFAKIEDQSIRLRKILGEYSGRINEVKEVDLAFEHVAVVKKVEAKKS